MESDPIPFAIQHDRAEAKRGDRMPLCEDFAAMLHDRSDSVVQAALRIQVNQRPAIGGFRVHVLHE